VDEAEVDSSWLSRADRTVTAPVQPILLLGRADAGSISVATLSLDQR
jgi:hypothetical protein